MSQQALVLDGPLGRIELTGAALVSLAARSAESIADVRVLRPRKRLRVTVASSSVHVEVGIDTVVGHALPDLGEAVQRSVARAVGASTGLPTSVDVTFEEIR